MTGARVHLSDALGGRLVGRRLADVAAVVDDDAWRIAAVALPDGTRRGVTVADGEVVLSGEPPDRDLVWLRRAVLDRQVIDTAGWRVTRVADLLLHVGDVAIEVVAVDLSLAGVLRRLGLRRLATRLRAHAVAPRDVHLPHAAGAGLTLPVARAALHDLEAEAAAALLARLPVHVTHASDVHEQRPDVRAALARHVRRRTGRRRHQRVHG